MKLLNSDSLADTWEVERVGLLAYLCLQLELAVSKNVLLFLH